MKRYKSLCPTLIQKPAPVTIAKARIMSAEDSAEFIRPWFGDSIAIYESFFVIYLNRSNTTIGVYKASQGSISATVADVRLIMKMGLECYASAMILVHNHPSGATQPSHADQQLTKKMIEAGKIMDIMVFDHIIVTEDSYYSFANDGLLF